MNKLLFITNSFGMGGAEKLLIDIIKILKNDYIVEVLTFKDGGQLKSETHEVANVYTIFRNKFHYFIFRKIKLYRKFKINKFIKENNYDFVVGFMEGKSTDLVSDIDISVKKIAWIHNDFRKQDVYSKNSEVIKTYSNMDKIVCVSYEARSAFFEKYKSVKLDSEVIHNLINEERIFEQSSLLNIQNSVFTFLNVAMLRKQKRQDRLVMAAATLKEKQYKFQIQIIGDGPQRSYLESLIHDLDVSDCVSLLGMKENPYPYIKACDCFVLSSDYEGYSIVVKEALFLKKLVLTTNVVGPSEILENGNFGLIVNNSTEALIAKMMDIIEKNGKYPAIQINIEQHGFDQKAIVEKLKLLFN